MAQDRTAAAAVARRYAEALGRINDLRAALAEDQARITLRPGGANWGDAGSLGHVVDELCDLVCFVTGKAQ